MQKTTLEQWRMLNAVVEAGGFNQAATRIHKSTSSIHHAVSKLEDSLGLKLLETSGRQTVLSQAGKVMLRRVSYLLEEVDRIESVAESLRVGEEAELRIAVDGAFCQRTLYAALARVSEQYPNTHMALIDTVLSGANELLEKREVDLALSPFAMPDGHSDAIYDAEFVALAHHQHPLHSLDAPIEQKTLKAYRQIVVRDSASEQQADAGWLGADQRWTVSHIRTSIDLLRNQAGYAWLPRAEVKPLLASGELKPLNLANNRTRRVMFYLNCLDYERLGPVGRGFVDAISAPK